jgi:mannose-6-phosphate isomerase
MTLPDKLYPIRFREVLRDYTFGARWIVSAFAKTGLPENHRIAETWEVVDRPKDCSVAVNGPLAGQTLHELIERFGADLLGADITARFGTRFPLLIKFLDASNELGEQAHHSDELARRRGIPDTGKTEAWYMIKVKPTAVMSAACRPGLTRAALLAGLLADQARACMREYRPAEGDAFLLYAGTMHYARGGLLFYEIMQNSDVYIGLRKWPRDMTPEKWEETVRLAAEGVHVEDGFDCQARPVVLAEGQNRYTYVLACEHFALERFDLAEPMTMALDGRRFFVLSQIAGSARVTCGETVETLLAGQSVLLPACLGAVGIEPGAGCALLRACVPDLLRDVVEPLRARGVADADIVALGGKTRLNPLARIVERRE